MQTVLTATRPRFSREPFPVALRGLMQERRLSYRQLAYKTQLSAGYLNHLTKGTRPVPADPVIATIGTALLVAPDFFLEYRLRQVSRVLGRSTQLIDRLYDILVHSAPVSSEIMQLLEDPPNGNGNGNGGLAEKSASGF